MTLGPWILVSLLVIAAVAIRVAVVKKHPERYGFRQAVDPHKVGHGPYPYVYVEKDGSARELHIAEREHLETRFHPAEGGPYTKWRYGSRVLGFGTRSGYLKRRRLPKRVPVGAAPLVNPIPPFSLAAYRAELINEGHQVVENPDGSFTATPPSRRRVLRNLYNRLRD